MKRFKDKKQHRLPGYDYSKAGCYFVTICIADKIPWFGSLSGGYLQLSKLGEMAAEYWKAIPGTFDNVVLDEWIIMPDHMHGIVIITSPNGTVVDRSGRGNSGGNAPWRVPTLSDSPTLTDNQNLSDNPTSHTLGIHPLIRNSLSSIINHYKGAVKKWANRNGYGVFKWQSRYHDRIIRDEREFFNVQNYIRANPSRWKKSGRQPEEEHEAPD